MVDAFHQWGSDLALGPTGDLATASGILMGQQRLLRRLLTNPGDYMWQISYGAGLGQFVGTPENVTQIRAVVRSQLFKESAVAQTPEPVIDVELPPAGGESSAYVYIRYVDSDTGQTQPLSLFVGTN